MWSVETESLSHFSHIFLLSKKPFRRWLAKQLHFGGNKRCRRRALVTCKLTNADKRRLQKRLFRLQVCSQVQIRLLLKSDAFRKGLFCPDLKVYEEVKKTLSFSKTLHTHDNSWFGCVPMNTAQIYLEESPSNISLVLRTFKSDFEISTILTEFQY